MDYRLPTTDYRPATTDDRPPLLADRRRGGCLSPTPYPKIGSCRTRTARVVYSIRRPNTPGRRQSPVPFKFEKLEIWKLAVKYVDAVYEMCEQLPAKERYNLNSQMRRAATSVALIIAEGSTGQSNAEQARFLSIALRSLIETVACQHLIARRNYQVDTKKLRQVYSDADRLAAKIQKFRKTLKYDRHQPMCVRSNRKKT